MAVNHTLQALELHFFPFTFDSFLKTNPIFNTCNSKDTTIFTQLGPMLHVHKCFILLRTQRCSKKSLERRTQRVALSTTLTNFDAILGVVVVGCKHACILDLRCERCLGFKKTACIVMNVTKFNKVFILLRLFCVILFLVQVSPNWSATYFKPKGE